MDVYNRRVPGCSVAGSRAFFSSRYTRGLTLLDLAITLAVSSVLLSIGVPALQSVIGSSRLTTQVNSLAGALALTRSEAARQSAQGIICKSSSGTGCTRGGAWTDGWIVFVDTNWNEQRDDAEQVLLVRNELPPGVTLTYNGFPTDNYVAYRPTGFAKMNGTFTFCSRGLPSLSRAVIVNWIGRPRISQTGPDGQSLICAQDAG